MTVAYKVFNNNNKLVDVFGKEQLCDFATEQICEYKDIYVDEEINRTPVVEPKDIVKIKNIVKKVKNQNEYVATVDQCTLVLKVIHYKVKEVEIY